MITLGSLALLRPLWLLALPALFILLRVTRPRDSALGDWRRAVDASLLDALLRRQGGAGDTTGGHALILALAVMALALSGPAVKTEQPAQFRNLDTALILLDVSRGDRLPQAAAAAQLVLAGGGARQMGLVLFAGDAYLASPLTDDRDALETMIFAVDDQTVPDGGSRPDRALAFARRVLREAGALAGDVVFISGAEGVDARTLAQATALAGDGHALHTLYVASADASGDAEAARRAAMATLAADGHGLAGEAVRADDVIAKVASRGVGRVEEGARRALEWRDYGRLLLLLAAVPLLLTFRREKT